MINPYRDLLEMEDEGLMVSMSVGGQCRSPGRKLEHELSLYAQL